MKRFVLLSFMGLMLLGCRERLMEGKPAPNIEAQMVNGKMFNLADYRGKYVIVDFWASWCGPCKKEAPHLVGLYSEYREKVYTDADGLDIVSIALERSDSITQEVAAEIGYNWPNQIVLLKGNAVRDSITNDYVVDFIPATYLIGPQGEMILEYTDLGDIEDYLDTKVKQ